MNISSNRYVDVRTWSYALRCLLGYPSHQLPIRTLAFTIGVRRDDHDAADVVQLAADMGTDLVYLEVGGDPVVPIGICLALLGEDRVMFIRDCEPWAADDTGPLQLLTATASWHLGPGMRLTEGPLPSAIERRKGVRRAMRRWAREAEAVPAMIIHGSAKVRDGTRYRDRVDLGDQEIGA